MLTAHDAAAFVFVRSFRGLDRGEVEALRSRVVTALAESERGLSKGLMVGSEDLKGVAFSTGFRGYDPGEVGQWLERASETLAERGVRWGSGQRRLTPEELRQLRFRSQVDGYDRRSVRRHLARVGAALEAHHFGRAPIITRRQAEETHLPLSIWGYSCEEVEAVLARVSSTLLYYEARSEAMGPDGDVPPPQ